jgi:sugar phosphate isomerase/epimerase
VWGLEPWAKLMRAQIAAERLGAKVVVTHPPFSWQRDYGRRFNEGIVRMHDETDVMFAVENMFPQRGPGGRPVSPYAPSWSLADTDYPHVTLDLSHTSVSKSDPLAWIDELGSRIAHLHLADGSGTWHDDHLVPGRGNQPCAEVLDRLGALNYQGVVVLEVNTRHAGSHDNRVADLAESLAFTRAALGTPVG